MSEPICFVYVFGSPEGPCKIGLSAHPEVRIKQVRFEASFPWKGQGAALSAKIALLEPFDSRAAARVIERRSHGLLDEWRIVDPSWASRRVCYEWFNVGELAAISAVRWAVAKERETA